MNRNAMLTLVTVGAVAIAVAAPAQETATPAPAEAVATAVKAADAHLLAYQTGEARKALDAVKGRAESDAVVAQAMGEILLQEKKYDEAVARLTTATKLAPADPEPFVALGDAYLLMKKSGDAVAAFKEALRLAGEKVAAEPEDAVGYYERGMAYQRLRQFDPSAEALQKALELSPDDTLTLFELGKTRAFQGKWKDAVDLLTRAIDRNSGIAYAYYYRGLAAEKLGKKDVLVNDMDRFLFLAPDAPEAVKARAIVQAAKR